MTLKKKLKNVALGGLLIGGFLLNTTNGCVGCTGCALVLKGTYDLTRGDTCQLKKVNEGNFEKEVLQSNMPIFVDFYANWCGVCHDANPYLKELEAKYSDRIQFVAYNCENGPEICQQFGVSALPTYIIFDKEEVAGRQEGFEDKDNLENFIIKTINNL